MIKKDKIKSYAFFGLGFVVMSFGISMSIRADIGVAPGSSIAYAVSKLTPLSVGWCTSFFHISCILAQLAIKRRHLLKLVLQFPLVYVFGRLIDLFYGLLESNLPTLLHRIIFLVIGMLIFSLGIRIIVGADILLLPPDALALTIGGFFSWPMSKCKLASDIVLTAAAILLMLVFSGDIFSVIGIGTVICAVATGPIIGLFTKLLPFFDIGKNA